MFKTLKSKILFGIGLAVLPISIVHTALLGSSLRATKATVLTTVLNNANSPELANGEGTMTDDKNVTWEYSNASDLNNGHVSLGHQGYFGISASTDWGYSGIESLTVTFSNGEGDELWLLTSFNGTDWSEQGLLTSEQETNLISNWNYLRFYSYDENNSGTNISSVIINYRCDGINAFEDSDFSQIGNIKRHDSTNLSAEYEKRSPLGHSTQAVRLTSTNGSSSNNHVTLFTIPETTLGKIRNAKVEYDYYYREKRDPKKAPGYPSVRLAGANDSLIGLARSVDSKKDLSCTDIGNGWWHIECYISGILQPAEHASNTTITGIVIHDNAIYTFNTDEGEKIGFVIIDNLRITTYGASACLTNAWDKVTINPPAADRYFIRENVCGTLLNVSYRCSDTSKATLSLETKQGNQLCYINGIAEGDIVVTITYTLGHLHQIVTIQTVTLHVVTA